VSLAWATIVYAGMILLGLCARVLAREEVPSLTEDNVLYEAADGLLPSIAAGIVIAAVLSAVMSTADSQLLVAASAAEYDMRDRSSGKGRGDVRPTSVLVARLSVLGLAAAAVVAALVISDGIFDSVLFAWSALGAVFGPLLLIHLFVGPVRSSAAALAMLVGFVGSVAAYSVPAAKGTAIERVLPFVLAFVVARLGAVRAAEDGDSAGENTGR
jgi:Na+/proline symporter